MQHQVVLIAIAIGISACGNVVRTPDSATEAYTPPDPATVIARAASLELESEYAPPPGDPLAHYASGFAKILCSAVFITGLSPDFAAENVGFFTSPYDERAKVINRTIDYGSQTVRLELPNGVTRVAKRFADQGCVTLPIGQDSVYFTPTKVSSSLPDPSTQPWPMGDVLSEASVLSELDAQKLASAVSAAFDPTEAMTAAFVVTWKGRIVAERYGDGIGSATPLESWSMGKSVTAALLGVLLEQGTYELWQPAPVPEWQGDGRAHIRIGDILQMSSGLRCRAPQDPDYNAALGYPDHLYLYTGSINSFTWAVTRPQQWPPGQVGRYRNCDPVLINYLIRLAVEDQGDNYHSFPRLALFDRIGIRSMALETDPYGNFLLQGYELASARDWARLGILFLQDGMWMGERILPEGFSRFVSSLPESWRSDGRRNYGAFFWINGENDFPVPPEAYYMAGAGGQRVFIIPSHDLVVVRMGHYRGASGPLSAGPGTESFKNALALLMEAVPASR